MKKLITPILMLVIASVLFYQCEQRTDALQPEACFTYTPAENIYTNEEITFTNCSENVETFTWYFGDGTESVAQQPTHKYVDAGIYSVRLVVQNKNLKDEIIQELMVGDAIKACIDMPQNEVYANIPFELSNCSVGADSYQWDFDNDGTIDSEVKNPTVTYDAEGNYTIKLIAMQGENADEVTQNVSVEPFPGPCSLWVPGSYQGWDPETASRVWSPLCNGMYSGYVFFPNDIGAFEFKFTTAPDWEHLDLGTQGTSYTMVWGGLNISLPGPGYYRLYADTNTMQWNYLLTEWGIAGTIHDGGWDNDMNMIWDAELKQLFVTANFVAGEFKFRANDGWALNYGINLTDGTLEEGGQNIPLDTDGSYTIILNLNEAVPAYEIVPVEPEGFFIEHFTADLGQFTNYSVVGDQVWEWSIYGNGCAYISGYLDGNYNDNEDWLISPPINLNGKSNVVLYFNQAVNYLDNWDNLKVLVSEDYDGSSSPLSASWAEITGWDQVNPGQSWTFFTSGEISMAAYEGKTIFLAFKYVSNGSTTGVCPTWEISDVVLKEN